MPFEIGGLDITCIAENDLRAKQYHFVEITGTANGATQVDVCDGAGDIPFGILQNKPNAGEEAVVRVTGVSRLIADDTSCAIGAEVGTSGDGQGVAKVNNKDIIRGIVVEAAAAAGDRASVLLIGPSRASL